MLSFSLIFHTSIWDCQGLWFTAEFVLQDGGICFLNQQCGF